MVAEMTNQQDRLAQEMVRAHNPGHFNLSCRSPGLTPLNRVWGRMMTFAHSESPQGPEAIMG
jgi:hypothetical protein